MAKQSILDPVTAYAQRVRAGQEIVSYLVRLACLRHLSDLEHATEKGFVWRPEKAQDVIDFFAEILCLPENTDAGETVEHDANPAPRPFVLMPWQAFIVGSLFGWYTTSGFRRYREAYIEIAKGNGKTPLCAGMMLWLLVADGQRGAQCFFAAVTREQANIAFADAVKMVNASQALRDLINQRVNNLAVDEDGSFLRPVSSEKRGLDGKRVHGACIDELHENPTAVVVNKMRAGTKGMRNALILKPTNSGFDRTSVCWAHHEQSRKVLEGTVQNESWFAFVCGLDPCDPCRTAGRWFPSDECPNCDSWRVEGPHWLKPSPNLGISIAWQYVRERVAQAKVMPSIVSDVLRFNFCVWTQGASRAIDMGKWAVCQEMPSDEELLIAPCFGCIDLGESDDLSAWGRLWIFDDGCVAVKMRFWIPEAAIEKYPDRPYEEWKRAGILEVTDGEMTDYTVLREAIAEDCRNDGVQSIGFDPRNALMLAQELQGEGIEMIKIPQGFALNEAIARTLELIATGDLCHGKNTILTWMASNFVLLTGTRGEKRISKERAPEKIDGMAALVSGIELAMVRRQRDRPADDPDLMVV